MIASMHACAAVGQRAGFSRTAILPVRAAQAPLGRNGFTLVEVLATVLLMAIILPVVGRGIEMATLTAGKSQHRTEAAGLAQSKLSELIVNGQWQGGLLNGDFGPDWPGYTWKAAVEAWPNDTQEVGMQQLDVQVFWSARNRQESLMLSGLVYVRPQSSS